VFGYAEYDSAELTATYEDSSANLPPVAEFDQSVSGKTVTLRSTSSDSDGSIVSYQWNLGDGSSQTGEMVTHTYAAAGDYAVTLTVTDDAGSATSTTQTVTIEEGQTDAFPLKLNFGNKFPNGKARVKLSWKYDTNDYFIVKRNGKNVGATDF
ncbi:PKD domain-containing protein, partial [Vibrio owensii]